MNSAERLLTVYDKLVSQQQDQPMVKTWAVVFDLDNKSKNLEDEVTTCIVALRSQIDFARLRLSANGVPNELTSPGFDRLKAIASPANLNQSWNGLRGNIQPPECRQAFTWSSWVLRVENENEISVEELSEVLRCLEELESSLHGADLSPYLHDFILRQVSSIRSALRIYGIQGARPIQEAMRKVVGDIKVEEEMLAKESNGSDGKARSFLQKTAEAIEKTAKVCDSVSKIGKFGENVLSLVSQVSPVISQYASKLAGE